VMPHLGDTAHARDSLRVGPQAQAQAGLEAAAGFTKSDIRAKIRDGSFVSTSVEYIRACIRYFKGD